MVKALIVIDMIKGWMNNTYDSKKIIQNQVKLIKYFKSKKHKVILAIPKFNSKEKNPVMIKLWGEEFKGESENQKLVEELSQFKFDKVIKKSEYSAFFKTSLEKYCKENKITELYFTGVFSGCCVYFSAVDAAYRKIQPYLIIDASSTTNKERHNKNCDDFKTMIGPILKTSEVLKKI
ncbi:MAG: isochorismatase family cysteine hydrolase [Candidatus Woesearchaeota archaeon]